MERLRAGDSAEAGRGGDVQALPLPLPRVGKALVVRAAGAGEVAVESSSIKTGAPPLVSAAAAAETVVELVRARPTRDTTRVPGVKGSRVAGAAVKTLISPPP